MSGLFPVAHLGLIFENDYLLAFDLAEDGGENLGLLNEGLSRGYLLSLSEEENPTKFNCAPLLCGEKLNLNNIAGGNLVLLAPHLYKSINPVLA